MSQRGIRLRPRVGFHTLDLLAAASSKPATSHGAPAGSPRRAARAPHATPQRRPAEPRHDGAVSIPHSWPSALSRWMSMKAAVRATGREAGARHWQSKGCVQWRVHATGWPLAAAAHRSKATAALSGETEVRRRK